MALAAALGVAEGSAGDAALAAHLGGGDGAGAIERVIHLRAELEAVGRAIESARRQRLEAIPQVWGEEAAALRDRARTLRAEAAERQVVIDGLLGQLHEIDGCDFIPAPSLEAQLAAVGIAVPPGATASASKTAALLAEAVRLEAEADALAARQVMMSGAVEGKDHAEVVDKVLAWDPMQIAPILNDVEGWLAAKEHTAAGLVRQFRPLANGRVGIPAYVLVWKDGLVDAARSKLEVREKRTWQAA